MGLCAWAEGSNQCPMEASPGDLFCKEHRYKASPGHAYKSGGTGSSPRFGGGGSSGGSGSSGGGGGSSSGGSSGGGGGSAGGGGAAH